MRSTLDLPVRARKPRTRGVTMVIDTGLPAGLLDDVVASYGNLIDLVKFGWGTSVVSPMLDRKIASLQRAGVEFFFGGTLFEKYLAQDRFDEFAAWCRGHGCRYVEVSNGTLPISNEEKLQYVAKLADEFRVISEVGHKDLARSEALAPGRWAECVRQDVDAGATFVVLEARESGRAGICRADGVPRDDVVDAITASGAGRDQLIFEAPSKDLQTYFIRRFGSEVNLGNVAPLDVIGLETLRLGLRADTMTI